MLVRRVCVVLPVLVFLFLFGSIAQAQWSVLKTFPAQVRSVYFLDQVGSSTTGFIGLANSTVWRTTDNGSSWNQVNTPLVSPNVQVTDFTFRTALQGWCSVRTPNNAGGAVWMTTDGGLTWSSVYTSTAFVSLAFCASTNALIASCWGSNAVESYDLGTTWTTFALPFQNGATFSGTSGVVGILSAPTPLYTSDGGRNWLPTAGLAVETWSPHGIPGTKLFFAAAEKTRQIYRSTDGGASWVNTYTFPVGVVPTGCIHGDASNLFVQTNTSGFYYSTDLGNSWFGVCGPVNSLDTRFYSKGHEIFAGDFLGNIWYTPNGVQAGNVSISLDRSAIQFSGLRCAMYDSLIHFTSGFGCSSAILTKAQIIDGTAFGLKQLNLPRLISGSDSLDVQYSPGPGSHDTGDLLLEFSLGSVTLDTIIHLSGFGRGTTSFTHDPDYLAFLPSACMTSDSVFVIHNLSCDSLTINAAYLTDSTHFALSPIQLPYKIGGNDSLRLHITASAMHDGTFQSELHLIMIGGAGFSVENDIPLVLTVQEKARPAIEPIQATLINRCQELQTAITIKNTQCDSIEVVSLQIADTTAFHPLPFALPAWIAPGAQIDVPIFVQGIHKGSYVTKALVRYQSGQYGTDTSISLEANVVNDVPAAATFAESAVDMGSTLAPCSASSHMLRLTNVQCRDMKIVGMYWDHTTADLSFDHLQLPLTLVHDTGTANITLHFTPQAPGVESNALHFVLDVDGVQVDTTLRVSGTGVSYYSDSVLTPVLSYGSVSMCQSREREALVVNRSCNEVIAERATLRHAAQYHVMSDLPKTLAPGDTLRLAIRCAPVHLGVTQDSLDVTISDQLVGKTYAHTIPLDASVQPSLHAVSLENATYALGRIPACSSKDTSFEITNAGTCDDVVITKANILGDGGLDFDPMPTFPITIPPGESVKLFVRATPHSESEVTSLVSIRGTNIDTTIQFTYRSQPGAKRMDSYVQDSIFTTRPCVPVIHKFAITNSGCDGITLTSVSLAMPPAESQFSLNGLPALPAKLASGDTLWAFVQFDPTANGTGVASLDIASYDAHYARSVALYGSVTGTVPKVSFGVAASDGSMACQAKAGDTVRVAVRFLDAVGDTTNLYEVTGQLRANWDLLTPTHIAAAYGWQLVTSQTQNDGSLLFTVRRDVMTTIANGQELLICDLYPTVTDTSATNIYLSDIHLNNDQPNYETCVLASTPPTDPVRFTLIDTCGSAILRRQLGGALAMRIISIYPNPIRTLDGTRETEVVFETAYEGPVTIVAKDLLGREQGRLEGNYAPGRHTVKFSLPNAAEGTYIAEVAAGGARQYRKLMVEGR